MPQLQPHLDQPDIPLSLIVPEPALHFGPSGGLGTIAPALEPGGGAPITPPAQADGAPVGPDGQPARPEPGSGTTITAGTPAARGPDGDDAFRPSVITATPGVAVGPPVGSEPGDGSDGDTGVVTGTGATPHQGTVTAAAGVCAQAITLASTRHGVPLDLMLAIGRVESGLNPWVINAAGQGIRFDDRSAAVLGVERLQGRGIASIDIGCMQVNLRWHPQAFATLTSAFDPVTNADYAARFLRRLYQDSGSWDQAAMRYHSGDPTRQQRYGCAVRAERARLNGNPMPRCGVPGPAVQTAATSFASGAAVVTPRSMAEGAVVLLGRTDADQGDSRVISGNTSDDRVVSGR